MSYPFTKHIAQLPSSVPFVGPEATERERGRKFVARIGANESVFGPSPKALYAMNDAVAGQWQYADPESFELRAAIAEHHGVLQENIVIGEGIDGLLGLGVRLFVEPGVSVVTSQGAYPTFNFHVNGFGGSLSQVPFVDDKESIDDLLSAAQETQARIVYLSNPDNPMGTWWDAATVSNMIARLPDDAMLFLDEAYCEFAPEGVVPPIDVSARNVIRFRTFSKAYGMAGARIGYAIGEAELIAAFNKVRNHYGINRLAQIGALAAIQDQGWITHIRDVVRAGRERISEIVTANGLTPLPSATNFVTVDCGADAAFANVVLDGLIEQDIFVRMPFAEPGNRCIRIGVGKKDDLDAFEKALPVALANARNSVS